MKKYKNPSQYKKEIFAVADKTLGYLYFMDKEHPLSSKTGRVWHHRHIASEKIGRWIKSSENVHHRDRDRKNNVQDNLEVINSISEHTIKHHKEMGHHIKSIKKCKHCNKDFLTYKQKFCSYKCMGLYSRMFNISKLELEKLVWEKPTIHVAKKFNVSDVAIARRCKIFGIKKPPRGYWAKKRSKKI